jgi:hypothetical protein
VDVILGCRRCWARPRDNSRERWWFSTHVILDLLWLAWFMILDLFSWILFPLTVAETCFRLFSSNGGIFLSACLICKFLEGKSHDLLIYMWHEAQFSDYWVNIHEWLNGKLAEQRLTLCIITHKGRSKQHIMEQGGRKRSEVAGRRDVGKPLTAGESGNKLGGGTI